MTYEKRLRVNIQLDDVGMSEKLENLDFALDFAEKVKAFDLVPVDHLHGDNMPSDGMLGSCCGVMSKIESGHIMQLTFDFSEASLPQSFAKNILPNSADTSATHCGMEKLLSVSETFFEREKT